MLKKDFESQNFAIFEEVVHNFGRPADDIIWWINAYFPTWSKNLWQYLPAYSPFRYANLQVKTKTTIFQYKININIF